VYALGLEDEALPQTPLKAAAGALGYTREDVALPRRARKDALPEHTPYADTGCEVHHSCLTCPLVRCRYDEPGGARRLLSQGRDRQIAAMQREGDGISEIARRFGVSRRTVFRALARGRRAARG
jgi:transcriptional regulator of acetoin/glycerol metabolism